MKEPLPSTQQMFTCCGEGRNQACLQWRSHPSSPTFPHPPLQFKCCLQEERGKRGGGASCQLGLAQSDLKGGACGGTKQDGSRRGTHPPLSNSGWANPNRQLAPPPLPFLPAEALGARLGCISPAPIMPQINSREQKFPKALKSGAPSNPSSDED